MTALRLALLGPPRITVDGVPLDVDTRKATALLAYLAVTGRPRSRDALTALLWPDSEPARGRGALRRTLSVLRRATGDLVDVTTTGELVLRSDGVWCDVTRSRELTASTRAHGHPADGVCPDCIEPLDEAEALHAGPLLDGFSLRDSPEFTEWRFLEAEWLARERAALLDRLIVARTRAGAFDAAIDTARRRLVLDPLHEQAHRQLMLLLTWADRRGEAIHQYRTCVAVLQRELGVQPLDRTTALHAAIVAGRAPPPPAVATIEHGPTGRPRTSLRTPVHMPLVGRAAELVALREGHRAAARGGHLVIVSGETGTGRTRLADTLADEVRAAGGRVAATRCHPDEHDLAYAPIVALLRAASDRDAAWLARLDPATGDQLATLLPELVRSAGPSAPGDGPGAAARFRAAVARALVAAVQGPIPGLLVVDDAHVIDDASLAVLRYLVHRPAEHPVCLLLTWRTDGADSARRLRAVLHDLGDAPRTLVEPGRLSAVDLEVLIDEVAPELGEVARADLLAATDGVPLIVAAHLRRAIEGVPEDAAGSTVPTSVREAFLPRLDALPEVASQVLTTAALVGRAFDLATVRRASGRSEEEVVDALDDLVRTGVVREEPPAGGAPRYAFTHEAMRALVESGATAARRRLLHGRVADALSTPDRAEDADQLAAVVAHHLTQAGRLEEAALAHRTAGQRAARLHAADDAVAHLEAALAAGHPDVGQLQFDLGDLHTLRGAYAPALLAYEAAAAADPATARLVDRRIAQVHLRTGDLASAAAYLESALASLAASPDVEPAERSQTLVEAALVRARQGRLDEAVALADDASAALDPTRPVPAQVHELHGILARRQGRLDEAQEHLARGVAAADAAVELGPRVATRNALALTCRERGDLAAAEGHLRDALALCEQQGDRHREAAVHNNLADVLHDAGRHEEAMDTLKCAVARFAEIGSPDRLEPGIWQLVEW